MLRRLVFRLLLVGSFASLASGLLMQQASSMGRRCGVLWSGREDPENVTMALSTVKAELASNSARLTVASVAERKVRSSYDRKAEAEEMLRMALEDVRLALRSEAEAAADRSEELGRSVEELKKWETLKRNRAATERELMASLASVASLTPEAEIAEKLAAVADAKAEIIAVDSALADEFGDASQRLVDASTHADEDAAALLAILEDLPDAGADSDAFRTFSWKSLDSAEELIKKSRLRADDAIRDARRLEQVILESTTLRAQAVDIADVEPANSVQHDDDVPPFKEAAKEVAVAGLETAAAFGDWVLSDGPEELAQDLAGKLRSRVN